MRRYDSYKDSGVEWIGEIPIGWKKSKIKYHFQLLSGYPFNSEDITNEERQFPIIRIGNVTSGKVDVFFDGEIIDKHPVVENGDYIISLTGDFSIRKWENHSSLLNQRCGLLKGISKNDLRFLFYFLPFQFRILEKTKYFTTLKNLSNGELLDLELPLPPLSEQQQIVSFLDTKTSLIDSLIEKTKLKIQLLKENRTSLINEVVTKGLNPNVEMKDSGVEWIGEIPISWYVPKLNYLLNGITDGTHGTHERVDNGKPLLSSKNVLDSGIYIGEDESQISEEEHEKIVKKGFPQKGDILLTVVGSIGRSCVYEFDYPLSFQRSVCFLRLNEKSNSYFTKYLIQSEVIQYQLSLNTKTSTQGGIYMNDLKRLNFILPPLSEQQQIVEYLDEHTQLIDKTISVEERRIELLKEYRQSLISEVVTGKRKVVTHE